MRKRMAQTHHPSANFGILNFKKNHEETTSTIPQDDISYSQQSRNSDKNITSHLFLTPNLQNPNPHHRKKKKSHLINDIIIRNNLNLLRKVHTLAYL